MKRRLLSIKHVVIISVAFSSWIATLPLSYSVRKSGGYFPAGQKVMNCKVSICCCRSVSYPSRGKSRILARTMHKVVFGYLSHFEWRFRRDWKTSGGKQAGRLGRQNETMAGKILSYNEENSQRKSGGNFPGGWRVMDCKDSFCCRGLFPIQAEG